MKNTKNQISLLIFFLSTCVILILITFQSCHSDDDIDKEEIKRMMAKHLLEDGLIRCVVPDTMKIGQSNRVIVSVVKGLNLDVVYEELIKRNDRFYRGYSIYEREKMKKYRRRHMTLDTIQIGSYVRVNLLDPKKKFDKNPLFEEEIKSIGFEEFVNWEWEITPKESGKFPLIVNLSTKVFDGYEKVFKEFKVFEKSILIQSDAKKTFVDFLKEFWQWIMGTLIFPLFYYLRNLWLKWKNKKEPREPIGFKSNLTKNEGSK